MLIINVYSGDFFVLKCLQFKLIYYYLNIETYVKDMNFTKIQKITVHWKWKRMPDNILFTIPQYLSTEYSSEFIMCQTLPTLSIHSAELPRNTNVSSLFTLSCILLLGKYCKIKYSAAFQNKIQNLSLMF